MRIGLVKQRIRTLRFRLMAWNALVVVVTGVVTLLGLREGARLTLVHELDQLLAEDMREIELSVAELGAAEFDALYEQLDRKAAGHSQHKWFAQLTAREGRVVYASNYSHAAPSPPELADAQPHTVGHWRMMARGPSPSVPLSIRVGASLESIHADIARLDRLVVIAGSLVLITAPLCGYWLAGRATRPLASMISTMDRVRPSQLNERLVIRGTGDELDRLSVTFNQLLDRIGRYLEERQDFVANAAHELRTPLAAIRSSIEVALATGRTPEEYESLLAEVMEESSSLEMLVNQLLLLFETEAEGLKLYHERVRLDEVIRKAVEMFSGVAEHRGIRLHCPQLVPVQVAGNRQHLRQVLHNLLDNALKFTPADGRVDVELAVDDVTRDACVRVRDTGSGISNDELPHVFDRFFRSARVRTVTGTRGTGLGTSICQAIVRAHGGTISVDSVLGTGSCFTVRLPLAEEESPPVWSRDAVAPSKPASEAARPAAPTVEGSCDLPVVRGRS